MSATVVPIQTPTRTQVVELRWPAGEDFDDMEATDVIVHRNGREQVDVGGGGVLGSLYLRFTAEDLVIQAERAKKLLDRVIDAVLDERQRQAEAEADRELCYCHVILEEGQETCGAPSCNKALADDLRGWL